MFVRLMVCVVVLTPVLLRQYLRVVSSQGCRVRSDQSALIFNRPSPQPPQFDLAGRIFQYEVSGEARKEITLFVTSTHMLGHFHTRSIARFFLRTQGTVFTKNRHFSSNLLTSRNSV